MAYLSNGIVYANKTGETINLFQKEYLSKAGATGNDGNDMLRGNSLNNRLEGGAGEDQLWGGVGGDDTLIGGSGSDAYWWGRGDGADRIVADMANKADAIIMYNVQRNEYGAINHQGDFRFIARDGSTLDLENWYGSDPNSRVQSFVYADNIAYAWNDGKGAEVNLYKSIYENNGIRHAKSLDSGTCMLRGGTGNDILEGGLGADQLWGGTGGSDTMSGGGGIDIYWWGKNDGHDTIIADVANIQDSIRLYNVQPSELVVNVDGKDCILSIGGESLTIKDWSTSPIDTLTFADNSTVSLKTLVQSLPATHQFKIEFDYSLDSQGYFKNNPGRQRDLEAAGQYWSEHIQENFATVGAGTQLYLNNPETDQWQYVTAGTNIDDIRIFVGAKDLNNGSTAHAAAGNAYMYSGDSLDSRYHSSQEFMPWVGSITFDSQPTFSDGTATSWWFDPTPKDGSDAPTAGNNKYDFVTVAIHEIGHVLGISSGITAYQAEKDPFNSNSFIGVNAVAANGGRPIPLIDGTHPNGNNGNFSQEVVMAYGGYSYVGHRVGPSSIDFGMLSDIGYRIV